MPCLLLSLTLCATLRDKPVAALSAVHAGALFADGYTTRRAVLRGKSETDPLARALIGSRPTWGRMLPIGAAVVIGQTYLAERMKHSRNGFVRRVWWIPQAVSIEVSVVLASGN